MNKYEEKKQEKSFLCERIIYSINKYLKMIF